MKNACMIFVISLVALSYGIMSAKTGMEDASTVEPIIYQKIGDIGHTKRIASILPQIKGQKTIISYVPTTGFYKGYKQRLVIKRNCDDTCTLFMQEKNGELKLVAQQICMISRDENKLLMKIDPFGDVQFIELKNTENRKKESKNRIVRIAQVMSS